MTALGIILAAAILLGVTKVGIAAAWDETLTLRLCLGPFSFSLLKEEKEKKPSKGAPKKKKGKNPWVTVLLQHWREVLSLVSRILRTPRIEHFSLHLLFGGKDQADAALNYGRACAVTGVLLSFLKSRYQVEEKNIHILYDAEASELKCKAAGTLSVRIFQLAVLAVAVLRLAYRLYQELPNSQKVV